MQKTKISDIVNNNVKFISQKIKKDFFGDAPAPFIGRHGYPNINVGVMSAIEYEEKKELDSPKYWVEEGKSVQDIVGIRSSLVNSRFKANAQTRSSMIDVAKEVGLATRPVEVEINLKEKPQFSLNTYSHSMPSGPNAEMKKAAVTSNPFVSSKVEKVHADTDLKSMDAMKFLYQKGFEENAISKILSVGAVGIEKNRKLVPTRWSITAVDDTLGKQVTNDIKQLPQLDQFLLYYGGVLGNFYLVLVYPNVWSYELFEMHADHPTQYSTDYEHFSGRKEYSYACEGGYYTVRLAIAEKLKELGKQGTAIAFRFVTKDYSAPLGVWVTREATRRSLLTCVKYDEEKEMIQLAKTIVQKKFNFDFDKLLKKSVLYNKEKAQKKLFDF